MIVTRTLSHFNWQLLRLMVREGTALTGKQLRMAPTRVTKDGTFLDVLVQQGLIKLVKKNENWKLSTYELTKLGKDAAEYGEYKTTIERPVKHDAR